MLGRYFLKRAHAGLPAILLGTLFNVLDAGKLSCHLFNLDFLVDHLFRAVKYPRAFWSSHPMGQLFLGCRISQCRFIS